MGVPAGGLAFTCCQVPIVYSLGRVPSIELELADGRVEHVNGSELGRDASRAIFERIGRYSRLTVRVPPEALRQ